MLSGLSSLLHLRLLRDPVGRKQQSGRDDIRHQRIVEQNCDLAAALAQLLGNLHARDPLGQFAVLRHGRLYNTAQAMRSPLFPLGSVRSSSAFAWITNADPSASRMASNVVPGISSPDVSFPSAPTPRLPRSPV